MLITPENTLIGNFENGKIMMGNFYYSIKPKLDQGGIFKKEKVRPGSDKTVDIGKRHNLLKDGLESGVFVAEQQPKGDPNLLI